MTRLMVDGIFFQIANTGIARVWRSLLKLVAASGRFEIFFLDRGNAPQIEGVQYVPFPDSIFAHSAADSMLIQKVCDHYKIDVFTSTYYTTPLTTPMLLMVHDMIPELFDFGLNQRGWMEKSTAICYAQTYLCVSHNTGKDLLAFYPEIPPARVLVAHNGVDEGTFHPRNADAIAAFRRRFDLDRGYFLFVGSRVQYNGYKNSQLFFDSLARMRTGHFDVFCVGGEPEIEKSVVESLPPDVRCRRVELTDDELALAYNGAIALVYPSLYEGFGMPVIEAMACGCPVITTAHGALAEAAGDAAHVISGISVDEMCSALEQLQVAEYRRALSEKGLEHARRFRWDEMARVFTDAVESVARPPTDDYLRFAHEWRRLREMQSSVDSEY